MNRNDDVPSHAADIPQGTPLSTDGPTVHSPVNSSADDTATQVIPVVPDPAASVLGSTAPAGDAEDNAESAPDIDTTSAPSLSDDAPFEASADPSAELAESATEALADREPATKSPLSEILEASNPAAMVTGADLTDLAATAHLAGEIDAAAHAATLEATAANLASPAEPLDPTTNLTSPTEPLDTAADAPTTVFPSVTPDADPSENTTSASYVAAPENPPTSAFPPVMGSGARTYSEPRAGLADTPDNVPADASTRADAAAAAPTLTDTTVAPAIPTDTPTTPTADPTHPTNSTFTPPVSLAQGGEKHTAPEKEKRSYKGLIISLVVVLILVAAGTGGWVWWKKHSAQAHDRAVSKIEHAFGTAAGTVVYATGVKNSVGDSGVNTQELDRLLSSTQSTVDGILYLIATPIDLPTTAVSVSDPYTASPGLVTARGVTYGVFAASMPDVNARNTSDLERTTEILTSQTDALAKEAARVAGSIETAKQTNAQQAYQDGQNSLLSKIAEASSYIATLGNSRTTRATQPLLTALNDIVGKARDLSTKSSQSLDEQKSLGTQMSDMANQIDQALQALKTAVDDAAAATSSAADDEDSIPTTQAPAQQQNTQQSQRSADAAYVCRQPGNTVRYLPSNGWTLDGARQDAASHGYTSCQVQGTW